MKKFITYLAITTIAFLLNTQSTKAQCHIDDWTALKALYESTNGDNWNDNTGWEEVTNSIPSDNCNLGNLFGVTLDNENRVDVLGLNRNNLIGTIPNELGNLSSLVFLALASNNLSGGIPPELGNLNNLIPSGKGLTENNLSGCYNENLASLCDRITRNFFISHENNFDASWVDFCATGAGTCIPCQIDDWTALKALYESTDGENWTNNTGWEEVTRNAPSANCNLDNLYGVNLDNNSRIDRLDLSNNRLNGNIPTQLNILSNLKHLILYGNQLNGSIPSGLESLSNLLTLDLSANQLTGSIPSELVNLSKLTSLLINNNNLNGCYSLNLSALCVQLTTPLFYGNPNISNGNNFDASWEDFCATGAGACSALPTQCNLNDWMALKALYESTNGDFWMDNSGWHEFTVDAPSVFCNFENLFGVYINDDNRIDSLNLSNNRLNGYIPAELGNLSNLVNLNLHYNQLNESIPPELGNLNSLLTLDLSSNELNGSIPPELGNLSNLEYLILSGNRCIRGSIPPELGNLSNLVELVMDYNCLGGEIPPELGNLSNLEVLVLSYNGGFTGSIPPELGNLSNLRILTFCYNQLSGSIPPELGNLYNLSILGLENNQLSGCYNENLRSLCDRINSNNYISDNNNFDALWDDFCATGAGTCPLPPCNIDDWTALKALYESTNGDNWINNTGWEELTGDAPSANCNLNNLFGVVLDNDSRVNTLDLSNNQLNGNIPPELAQLSNLTSLKINNNNLGGFYPNDIYVLCNQLTAPSFNGNADVSQGNNFNATWEDFCAIGAVACDILTVDWTPFPYNQKTWFEFSNDNHYSISQYYADSLRMESDNSHYYFHLKYLNDKLKVVNFDDIFVSCLDSVSNDVLWLDYFEEQAEDFVSIKHPFTEAGGAYFFKGNLVFDPLLEVGESIQINSDAFNDFDYVNIECTEKKYDTFLGKTDSVKVFKVTAIKDGQPYASAFDDFEYVLSKNYGFIKFLPFPELLKAPETNAKLVGFTDDSGNLNGKSSIRYFLPYEVGDVLYWKEDEDFGGGRKVFRDFYYEDSIISVTVTEDIFSYTFSRTKTSRFSTSYNYYYQGDLNTYYPANQTTEFNLNREEYDIFNHAIYGVDVIYDICGYSLDSDAGIIPRIAEFQLTNNPFSFEEGQQSYDLNYECSYPKTINTRDCSPDNASISYNMSTTYNSVLGLISTIYSTGDSNNSLRLIYYKKGDKEFKPGYQLADEYSIYDPPVDLWECSTFYPYLTPESSLNVPIELNCRDEIWSFPQTVIVRDAGEGECNLSNLEIIIDECEDENNFTLLFGFDFKYEGNFDFVAMLNGAVIDTFTYKDLYRWRSIELFDPFCYEANIPESWEIVINDLEFPACSISKSFTVPNDSLVIPPVTGALDCCKNTEPILEWERNIGRGSEDEAYSIQQTSDGGYIVVGSTGSFNPDYWIVKLNESGNLEWEKEYGGSRRDLATSVQQTTDGGYIVAGRSSSDDGDIGGYIGGYDFWIIKLDGLGNLVWEKNYGGTDNDWAYSIKQTTDGGYIIAGHSFSNNIDLQGNNGRTDYWIVKIDQIGNLQWENNFGGSSSDLAYSVQPTIDGGYIVAGYSNSNDGDVGGNNGSSDFWIVKLDELGNLQWENNFGGSQYEHAHSIQQTTDGGYIVAGYTGSEGRGYRVVKIDEFGNLQWGETYRNGGDPRAYSIQQTTDGGYIVAGSRGESSGTPRDNIWIIKLDSLGNEQWEKEYGGSSEDVATSVQQTTDGGYVVAGYSSSDDGDVGGNNGDDDFWILKLSCTENFSSCMPIPTSGTFECSE